MQCVPHVCRISFLRYTLHALTFASYIPRTIGIAVVIDLRVVLFFVLTIQIDMFILPDPINW